LHELTFPELRRGVEAVSQIYVQKRQKLQAGEVFSGKGKRAAFSLFYGVLHFLTLRAIAPHLLTSNTPPKQLVDLGCGTGIGGIVTGLHFPNIISPVAAFD